jgi:hypothetical protein
MVCMKGKNVLSRPGFDPVTLWVRVPHVTTEMTRLVTHLC